MRVVRLAIREPRGEDHILDPEPARLIGRPYRYKKRPMNAKVRIGQVVSRMAVLDGDGREWIRQALARFRSPHKQSNEQGHRNSLL